MKTETLQGGRIASFLVFAVFGLLASKYFIFFWLSIIPLMVYLGFSVAYSRKKGLYAKRYAQFQNNVTGKQAKKDE